MLQLEYLCLEDDYFFLVPDPLNLERVGFAHIHLVRHRLFVGDDQFVELVVELDGGLVSGEVLSAFIQGVVVLYAVYVVFVKPSSNFMYLVVVLQPTVKLFYVFFVLL